MPDCTNASVVTIGTVNAMTGQTIHYTYDPLDRLTAADYIDGRYFHYSYDAVGNRLSQESKSDPGGNPASSTYTYDPANRLTSVNGVSYSWDDNGDLLSDGTSSYEYDAFSHLTKVVDGSDTYEFSYDEQGNRVGQAVNGNWTYYDLDLNAGLTEVLTAQDEDYLYGLGSTPLAQNDPGDIDYLFTDGLGSVRQVVRGDSYCQVTLTESYDPFGNLLSSLGNSSSAFGYAGQWGDGSGLMNMRARYYSPLDGRFLTEDSWTGDQEQPMSYNPWLYVYANPIVNIDPTGKSSCYDPVPSNCQMALNQMYTYASAIKQIVKSGGDEPVEGFAQFVDFSKFVSQSDLRDMMWAITLVLDDMDANKDSIWPQVWFNANSPDFVGFDWLPYRNNPEYDDHHWGGTSQVWVHSLRGDWNKDYWDKTANQAYHFWFYVAVTFFDGVGWAEIANEDHDGQVVNGPWEKYDYSSSPENQAPPVSGISQPDYELAFQGMNLGEQLKVDSDFQELLKSISCDLANKLNRYYQWTDPGNWIRNHLKD